MYISAVLFVIASTELSIIIIRGLYVYNAILSIPQTTAQITLLLENCQHTGFI